MNAEHCEPEELDRLMPLVYNELRRLARSHLRGSRGSTLQPTVLVHEAYLRLRNGGGFRVESQTHFHALVAHLMRCVLVDHARRNSAAKRGAGAIRIAADAVADERDPDVLAVDEALSALAAIDPEKSRIVELRFFGGLSTEEIAALTGSSPRTVARQWSLARAWLYGEIRRGEDRSR